MLYNFKAGLVHPLPQELVPSREHYSVHCLFDQLPGPVLARSLEGPSLMLDEGAQFVCG